MRRMIACLFILSVTCLGCVGEIYEDHYHPALNIFIGLPQGWEQLPLDPPQDKTSMAFWDGMGGRIVLTHQPKYTLEERYYYVLHANQPVLDEGEIISLERKILWFTFETGELTNIIYMFEDEQGRVFSIVCTMPSDIFKIYRIEFDRTAKSFRSGQ